MAVAALDRDDLGAFAGQAVLRSYAQILFSRSPAVGAVLLLATLFVPEVGLYGLTAVAGAFVVTRIFRLDDELTRTGLFGYNALLVGLGGGVLFGSTVDAHALVAIGIVTAVFMTAALYSALGATFNLPPLTLPFLFVFYLVLGSARVLDVPLSPLLPAESILPFELPRLVSVYLQSLGALFFVPRTDAGLVVFIALLMHSRIAVLLSLFGFGIAALVESRLMLVIDGSLPMVLGYNFLLTAIALGGVWFVPSASSLLLAVGGALVCGLAAVGLVPLMTIQALPLLILPFNLTIILVLYAMRQRLTDGQPKAVDFAIGTPEENLNYYRTRIARFGAHYTLRFRAPFLGRWVCTQGVEGKYTHKRQWKHAFDFEVAGPDGKTFRDRGEQLRDYLCFRLPVLAAADGTVVRVVDDIEDNPIGTSNLRHNWGNLVLLYHAPGLYSVVAHLARGSTKVTQGQLVRRGDVLGACGASGRAPIPHLHFQLQATPVVGGPTIATELHDVVRETEDTSWLEGTLVVQDGQIVRNLEPGDDDLGLPPPVDSELTFEVSADGSTTRETVVSEIDLLGNTVLRSEQLGTRAFVERSDDLFRIYDVLGRPGSVLSMMQAAAGSLPTELGPRLRWHDYIPRRHFAPWWARILGDFVAPFVRDTAETIDYRVEREGSTITVLGTSRRRRGDGPVLRTRAVLEPGRGLVEIEVASGGRRRTARRVDPESGGRS